MNCRNCNATLDLNVIDLGYAPHSNGYLGKDDLNKPEASFPLRVKLCESCWLVQTEDYIDCDDIFDETYAYFSSASKSYLQHAFTYVETIVKELKLDKNSSVIEIASNDGYLLKNFLHKNIPCFGIEPTLSTAEAAKKIGVPVIIDFLTVKLANQLVKNGKQADLIIGNNVYAHVPDLVDFTEAIRLLLKEHGTVTLEFPHLMQLLKHNQFDTIYHEHYSYHNLDTVTKVFQKAGLRVWKVDEIPTHGGSLRVYGCLHGDTRSTDKSVATVLKKEKSFGLFNFKAFRHLQTTAESIKFELLSFLLSAKANGKVVCGYGAAAKGNTLLNYSGIRSDLIPFIFDASPSKQNKFMPGSHIPILSPKDINKIKPDYILILPWNIKDEVMEQLNFTKKWGAKFVTAIPKFSIL